MFVPLHDENNLKSIPFQFVTVLLIALNVAVYFAVTLNQAGSFAMVPGELRQVGYFGGPAHGPFDGMPVPEYYTLVTYMFFHANVWHLAGNMLFLWVFGDNVEDAVGHIKFLIFYILCGVAGGYMHSQLTLTPDNPLIGASGAVAGVVAAYLVLHPRVHVWVLVARFFPLRIRATWALGFWIAMQVVMVYLSHTGVMKGPVAWWAHIGGLIAGAILIVFLRRPGVPLFDRELPAAR